MDIVVKSRIGYRGAPQRQLDLPFSTRQNIVATAHQSHHHSLIHSFVATTSFLCSFSFLGESSRSQSRGWNWGNKPLFFVVVPVDGGFGQRDEELLLAVQEDWPLLRRRQG